MGNLRILTNLYSQKHFPSLDYTLSFHIGLMMRLKSRSDRVSASDPSPFDEVLRRGGAGPIQARQRSRSRRLSGSRDEPISLTSALRRTASFLKRLNGPSRFKLQRLDRRFDESAL